MKRIVVYDQENFLYLPRKIIEKLWSTAQKGYGCKFVSRETGEELSIESFCGLFIDNVREVLNK